MKVAVLFHNLRRSGKTETLMRWRLAQAVGSTFGLFATHSAALVAQHELELARRALLGLSDPYAYVGPLDNDDIGRKLRVLDRLVARGDLVRALRRQGAWS